MKESFVDLVVLVLLYLNVVDTMATKLVKDMSDVDPNNSTWVKKMRTLFRHMDVIGNGHLLVDDFIEIATTLMNAFPKMSSHKGDELVAAMVNLW